MPRKSKKDLSVVIEAKQRETSARKLAEEAVQESIYPVKNLIHLTVTTDVTDVRGNKKRIMWKDRGVTNYLTGSQVAEVAQNTKLFTQGVLHCPEVIDE